MSRSIKLLAVAVIVLFVLSSAQNTFAVLAALDQQQLVIDTEYGLYTGPSPLYQFLGQTFTAGLTGSLTEVDLAIACFVGTTGGSCAAFGPVVVEIHSVDPNGALLGSTSQPSSAFPMIGSGNPTAFIAFFFSSPPAVVAGSVYAIVITTSNADGTTPRYIVGATTHDPYPAGMNWGLTNSPPWKSFSTDDLAFKTYVAPVIPEYPLGLPLLAMFMVISYGLIRRRTSTKKL